MESYQRSSSNIGTRFLQLYQRKFIQLIDFPYQQRFYPLGSNVVQHKDAKDPILLIRGKSLLRKILLHSLAHLWPHGNHF